MRFLRKHFRKPKRVNNTPSASMPFDVDEFIELIVRKQARKTSWRQNEYIRRKVKENAEAAQAWQDAKDTSPHEHFSLTDYHPLLMKALTIFLVAIVIAAGIFAFRRYYNVSVTVQIERKQSHNLRFIDKRLDDVAVMIENNYSKQVIFDRKATKRILLSGRMDTSRLVEDFLEDLRINGIDNYVDDKGRIHIK